MSNTKPRVVWTAYDAASQGFPIEVVTVGLEDGTEMTLSFADIRAVGCNPWNMTSLEAYLNFYKSAGDIKRPRPCEHIWSTYVGLTEVYEFCTECNAKRPKEIRA